MTKLGDITNEITTPASDDKLYLWDTSAAAGSRDAFVEVANIFNAMDNELGYFADGVSGSTQYRLRDRVFIGDACDYDGNETVVTHSWLGDLGEGTSTSIWIEKNATLAAVSSRGIAISGAARSYGAPGLGGGTLGVIGYAVNDNGDLTHNVWGGYFEAVRMDGSGQAFGVEINATNLEVSPNADIPNPYNGWSTEGTTVALALASGGGAVVWPTSYDVDVGLEFHPNSSKFRSGIIFRNGALTRDSGVNGPGHAILLAYDHLIEWYEFDTDTQAAYITSNVTNADHDQRLIFHNGGLSYRNGSGNTIFTMQDNQNTVANYTYVGGTEAGTSPFISVAGSDTHIDIRLVPKGTAYVQFGTVTASSDAAITGYVTIKAANGDLVKLARIN